MQFKIPTTYLAGLAAYAALIGLSATPFLPWPLAGVQLMQLAIAGGLASLLVGAMLALGLDELVKDPAACFTQALLGMGISMALYTRISGDIRPEVLDVALVWIAIGVSHLGVVRTAVLLAIYFGLYGFTTYPDLLSGNDLDRGQALYGLGVSVIVSGVLYSRARHYAHINEHKQLHEAKLEEAEGRIQALTVQDGDTTALKQSIFATHVLREKARIERNGGGSFAIGMIEIDGHEQLQRRLGDSTYKLLLREFSERVTAKVLDMDTAGAWPDNFQPLGRLASGRFGLLLPRTTYDGAIACAEQLHGSAELHRIRAGETVAEITFSIGITEYVKNQTMEEVMQMAERALRLAQSHNGNDIRGLKRAVAA